MEFCILHSLCMELLSWNVFTWEFVKHFMCWIKWRSIIKTILKKKKRWMHHFFFWPPYFVSRIMMPSTRYGFAILNIPRLERAKKLHRFLGVLNFYHCHLPRAAEFQKILTAALTDPKTKGTAPVQCSQPVIAAFKAAKKNIADTASRSPCFRCTPCASSWYQPGRYWSNITTIC